MGDQKPSAVPKLELPGDEFDHNHDISCLVAKGISNHSQTNGSHPVKPNSNRTRSPPPTQIPAPVAASSGVGQRTASSAKSPSNVVDSMPDQPRERAQRAERNSPSWPTSPRLKSPPPSSLRTIATKKSENGDQTQSNTSIKRLAPASAPDLGAAMHVQSDASKEQSSQSMPRASGRGASAQATGLETVAEGSVPTTPSIGPVAASTDADPVEGPALSNASESPKNPPSNRSENQASSETVSRLAIETAEGSSASAPTSRATSTSRPSANLAKRSFTSLTSKKPAVEPMRSMTVETETVSSTSQLLGDRGRDGAGSVRAKPSVETIRPKKEKKKISRKAPSLHAGTGTSKADIFEAKVASAVDEADSSDSDETFVYESNPPEPRPTRHHSRTPSATSTTSQADHGIRGKHGVRSGSTAIPGKKSMKFSSGAYGNQLDVDGSGADSGRHVSRNNGSTMRHHHIGRYGRNGHPSVADNDSHFMHGNRLTSPRTPNNHGARHSRPTSPRPANDRFTSSRKSINGGYDTYDDGADDERAPLIGSVRVNRNRHSRRPGPQFRTMEFTEYREPRCWPRYGGCFLLFILIALVGLGVTTFVLALNRPLLDVEVRRIQNVLTSEQELMLDLKVQAVNPNLFAITVNELDVDLFAESPYAGEPDDDKSISERPARNPVVKRRQLATSDRTASSWLPPFWPSDGVDKGTDPIDDPDPGPQKLTLGNVRKFDSPLTFDAAPFNHSPSTSDGAIRLAIPSNRTARWDRVIQHRFELIVRGVIKYQLPLSSHIRSAKIGSRVKVSPDHDGDDNSNSTSIG